MFPLKHLLRSRHADVSAETCFAAPGVRRWPGVRRPPGVRRGPLVIFHLRDHRIQRLHQQPALFDGDPPAEHHRLVVFVETVEAFLPPSLRLARRSLRPLAAPAVDPHQPFHVLGGAVAGDVQQLRLVLGRGRAGHGADLGVADLAALEGSVDHRQLPQRAGHADLFPGHQLADAALPAQPVGQGADPGPGPALLAVELLKELEEPVLGGVEVPGQGGDLGGERLRAFFPGRGMFGRWTHGHEGLGDRRLRSD